MCKPVIIKRFDACENSSENSGVKTYPGCPETL